MVKKLIIPAVLAAALLGGCANSGTGTASTATVSPVKFVSNDIANSIAEAKAANPPDTQWINCMTYVQKNLNTLQGSVNNAPAPTGVLSAAELARLAVINLNSGLSPTSKVAFEDACGPLVMDMQNQALSLGAEFTTAMGALAIKNGALAALP